MSLENQYRALMEAEASRSTDQAAVVDVTKTAPVETAEQKKKAGAAGANRKADGSGTVDAHGDKPKAVPAKVAAPDVKAPSQTMESEEITDAEMLEADEAEAAKELAEKMKYEKDEKDEKEKGDKKEMPDFIKDKMKNKDDVKESSCDDDGDDEMMKEKMKKDKMKKEKMESATDATDVKVPSIEEKIGEISEFKLSDELGGLLESEGLEEEFKVKAISIFEAAVKDATKVHVESLQDEAATLIKEEVEAYKIELDEQVEKYLDYVVVEWAKENKLAIQSQARNEISESFMSGLKDLLEEHYIELPEDKLDMYEAQLEKNEVVEKELTEQVNRVLALEKELAESKKLEAVNTFVYENALTDVEAEKIRSLAESVAFDSVDTFNTKLGTLKENYFPEKSSNNADMIVEDVEGDVTAVNEAELPVHDAEMQGYLDMMKGFKR
jgi:hypothetical protein